MNSTPKKEKIPLDSPKREADYTALYKQSITPGDRETFWFNQSKEITWIKPPSLENILKCDRPPFYRWFTDATLNVCYNVVDRHIKEGNGHVPSIISHCAYTNSTISYTYYELYQRVNILSKILIDNNVKKGDTVIIYMPMIPESIFAMLACTRIGAVHSVVFGGFASAELADRINDARPKMVITASVGIEPRKKIPYYPLVVEAIKMSNVKNVDILLVQRKEVQEVSEEEVKKYEGKTLIYNDIVDAIEKEENVLTSPKKPRSRKNSTSSNYEDFDKSAHYIRPVEMNANEPFYILYTSGTTGSPKGVVRDCGAIVPINYTMKNVMNINKKDTVFSTGDIGWIVGHVFVVYGPLLRGATTIIMEGKPVGTPDSGKCWDIINKYKVKAFYTAPTALRAIKREDPEYATMRKYDLSSLESIHMAGERCDPETYKWIQKGVGEDKLINDQWWQTESGYPICCNNLRIYKFKSKPGSALKPQPGFNVKILDDEDNELPQGCLGRICIELPMPPAFMLTLNGNDEAFIKRYISKDHKYYISGDCGYFDEDGDIFIMTRIDDMIKTAGHRLSTGRMEEVILKVKDICEAAVVPIADELKGELPFAFIVVNEGVKEDSRKKELCQAAKDIIVKQIGAISRLKNVVLCERLPKTKSGKIVRSLLKEVLNSNKDKQIKIGNTVENGEEIIKEIRELLITEKVII